MYTMARLYWSLCRLTHPSNVSGGAYIGVMPPVSAGPRPLQVLGQPEVGHLDVLVYQEDVLRLDVQMLELVLGAHQVEGLGRLLHVPEQFLAGDPRQPAGLALGEPVVQVLVGQLHHDDKLAVHDVEPLDRQHERVADALHPVQRLVLLLGRPVLEPVQVAGDELDCLRDPAGRSALHTSPHPPRPNREMRR